MSVRNPKQFDTSEQIADRLADFDLALSDGKAAIDRLQPNICARSPQCSR